MKVSKASKAQARFSTSIPAVSNGGATQSYKKCTKIIEILLYFPFQVASGRYDLGLGEVAVLYQRYLIIDYTKSMYHRDLRFVHTKPEPVDSLFAFVYPFDRYY